MRGTLLSISSCTVPGFPSRHAWSPAYNPTFTFLHLLSYHAWRLANCTIMHAGLLTISAYLAPCLRYNLYFPAFTVLPCLALCLTFRHAWRPAYRPIMRGALLTIPSCVAPCILLCHSWCPAFHPVMRGCLLFIPSCVAPCLPSRHE